MVLTGGAGTGHAWPAHPAPTDATGPTGSTGPTSWIVPVTALGADPVISVTERRKCVHSSLSIAPRYSGGRVVRAYLFVNGQRAWSRSSGGAFRLKAKRFPRGVNAYEVIAVFADGRSASWVGTFTRCGARH